MTPTSRVKTVAPAAKVPFLGRLEVRVVAALSLLGILCVGASAYVVQLAVDYFDQRVTESLGQSEEIATHIEPFYHELVDAHISAYTARATAMANELALFDQASSRSSDSERLAELMQREHDVVALVLERADGSEPSNVDREDVYPEEEFDWFDANAELRAPDGRTTGHLRVVVPHRPADRRALPGAGAAQAGDRARQERPGRGRASGGARGGGGERGWC